MATTFKKGDKAKLNSGSPVYTITRIRKDGLVDYYWIGNDGKKQKSFAPSACLTKIE